MGAFRRSPAPKQRQWRQMDITFESRRGDCYKLLAACFYLPQREEFLQEDLFGALSASLEKVCPDAGRSSEEMGEAFRRSRSEELEVDYAKLFVGPFGLKAPPYGSLYLDEGHRVMGDSTMEVIQAYRKMGVSIDDAFTELPDHIAVELEFMYYLIHQEVAHLDCSRTEAGQRYMKTQEEFLGDFLLPWIPPFCEKIRQGTETAFYRALADCVSTFLRGDMTYLNTCCDHP